MSGWDIFPYETDGLRVKALEPPVLPEPPREGEGGSACHRCEVGLEGAVWYDDSWLLVPPRERFGIPYAALLMPREHYDFGDLPDDLAGEMGRILVHLDRAVTGLGDIGRMHVQKIGDGGAHLHLWLLARPAGILQLQGSCLADWMDVLPPVPQEQWDADQQRVAQALAASYGGTPVR